MKKLLTWIWCFPQMLVGWIVKLVTKAENWGDHYRFTVSCGSVSLGTYIFLCPSHWGNRVTIGHEKGHTKQSYILGWLYIPVILIPSMIWAGCFQKYREKHNVSYYSFYTERWADKLAGIER
jgi:hypothetical protein